MTRALRSLGTDLLLVGPAALAVVLFIFLPVGVVTVITHPPVASARWASGQGFGDCLEGRFA